MFVQIDNKKYQTMMEERIRSKVREKKRRAENESNLELDLIAEAMERRQHQKQRGERHINNRLTSVTSSPPRHAGNRSITVDNTNNYAAAGGAGAGNGVVTGGSIGWGTAEGLESADQELASAQHLRRHRYQVDVLADLLISMHQQQQQHQHPFSDSSTPPPPVATASSSSNRLFPGMVLLPANHVMHNSRGFQSLPTLAIAPPATGRMTYAGSQETAAADPLALLLEDLLYRR